MNIKMQSKTQASAPRIGFGRRGTGIMAFGPQVAFEPEGVERGGAGDPEEPSGEVNQPAEQPKEEPKDNAPKAEPKDDDQKAAKPSDKEAELLKEVMDKKGKLKEAKSEIEKLKGQLSRFDGIDPDQVRALLDEKKAAEQKKLEEKGQWDELKKQMNEAHAAELSKKDQAVADLQSKLDAANAQIQELTVGNAFSGSKFIADELVLTPAKARVVYGDHFDVEDGQVVAYDKPKGASNRTMLVDGKGDPLGFEDAIKKIVEADPDRDNLIRSSMKKGAGSKGQDVTPPKTEPELKGVSRIEAALSSSKK